MLIAKKQRVYKVKNQFLLLKTWLKAFKTRAIRIIPIKFYQQKK